MFILLQERTKDHSNETEAFKDQLATRSNEYVEEILSPHFGGIMQFVRDGESMLEKEQHEELQKQESLYKHDIAIICFYRTFNNSFEQLGTNNNRTF